MTAKIFNDPQLQAQFDRDGYVVVPFLNTEEVAALAAKFNDLHTAVPAGFYSTTFNASEAFKQSISEFTEGIYANKVDGLFHDIKKLGSSYLCKSPGPEGKMPVHNDWTVTNESKYYSVTVWVPLVDTDENNGAIRILPGSHKFSDALRGPTLPDPFAQHHEELWKQMELLPMKAGEAFIFNHAVLHASSANTTDKARVAITYGLIPAAAELMLYHKNEEGKIEKYLMPEDMFQRYHDIGQRPDFGELVDVFDYTLKPVGSLKLNNLLTKTRRARTLKPIFKDPEVQAFFEKEGYARLPILEAAEVQVLLDYYKTLGLIDEGGHGFHISMDSLDKEKVGQVVNKIFEVALPKAEVHFKDAKAFVASFVIKEPNPMSVVPVHQDWTFVDDEDQYSSVTCWVPLLDTTMDNGALGVVRGSHNFFNNFRPSPAPPAPSPIEQHMFTIFPYLKLIEMKAGEALIFDNRTFHGSPSNTTDVPRIAFGIGFTHKDAKLTHYTMKPGSLDTVLKYNIDEPFFRKYENKQLSKMYYSGELITGYPLEGEEEYILPQFTSEELVALIKENGNEFNVPMCEKLATLFNYNMDGSPKHAYSNGNQEQPAPEPELAEPIHHEWVDDRPFFSKYSPINIAREIKHRLVGS